LQHLHSIKGRRYLSCSQLWQIPILFGCNVFASIYFAFKQGQSIRSLLSPPTTTSLIAALDLSAAARKYPSRHCIPQVAGYNTRNFSATGSTNSINLEIQVVQYEICPHGRHDDALWPSHDAKRLLIHRNDVEAPA
jgi:hypothetical protein